MSDVIVKESEKGKQICYIYDNKELAPIEMVEQLDECTLTNCLYDLLNRIYRHENNVKCQDCTAYEYREKDGNMYCGNRFSKIYNTKITDPEKAVICSVFLKA